MHYSNRKRISVTLALFFTLSLFLTITFSVATAAESFANPDFQKLWNRTDKQVADGAVSRSFLWGPGANTAGLQEDYAEAPGGKRLVQYFDKSRMEITNPNGDKNSQYYVTNGLIAKELMTGQLQLGDAKFEQRPAAEIGVAGDQDDTNGPTYKALGGLTQGVDDDSASPVVDAVDRDGNVRDGTADYGKYNVVYAQFVKETKHNIAKPFWDYLNQSGPVLNVTGQSAQGRIFDPVFFATGFPTTEPVWAKVKVANVVKDVLVQGFERRVLTYTPSNSAAFQVEMGNVGQHYYKWRYAGSNNGTPPVTPTPTPTQPPASSGNVPAASCLPAGSNVTDLVQACVDKATPSQRTDVTVFGRLVVGGKPASGVAMNTTWHYKSKDSFCDGTTGADGVASCSLTTGSATSGFKVDIDVVFKYNGKTYTATTSFTPQ